MCWPEPGFRALEYSRAAELRWKLISQLGLIESIYLFTEMFHQTMVVAVVYLLSNTEYGELADIFVFEQKKKRKTFGWLHDGADSNASSALTTRIVMGFYCHL